MRSDEVIYPGPARIVMAAASELRDPDLIERYREEWLANLQRRTHLQQWRDAVSLLLRGVRATRWAYHETGYSRSRVVVASQATTALAVAIVTFLLFTTTPSLRIPLWVFVAGNVEIVTRYYPSILTISLAAAATIGLALLTKRSWRVTLGWWAIGLFTI